MIHRSIRAAFLLATAGLVLTGCAVRSDYNAIYYAEQGDLNTALSEARNAQGEGIDGFIFGTGASECRDFNAVVTVLVAKGDFASARSACSDYENRCAVVSDSKLCFSYPLAELESARNDSEVATSLTNEAKEALHFRWLMIRDDYEGRPLRRPIY